MPPSPEPRRLPSPEFSRPVPIAKLAGVLAAYPIEATETERGEVARRLELPAIAHLSASVSLRRLRGSIYELAATLAASVTQVCVVTLEPFAVSLSDEFTLLYRLPSDKIVIGEDDQDEYEFLDGETIDIGEAVTQQLSLVLDPYPRASGVSDKLE